MLFFFFISLYVVGPLKGFFSLDYFQLQANAFRQGEVSLLENVYQIRPFDLSLVGEKIFMSWGPIPAVIYAIADIIWSFLFDELFPKTYLLVGGYTVFLYSCFLFLCSTIDRRRSLLVATVLGLSPELYTFFFNKFSVWEIAVFYGVVFYTIGLACRSRSRIVAQVFYFLAAMSQPFFYLLMIPPTTWAYLKFSHERKRLILLILTGVGLQFFYNYLRFKNVLEFGEEFKFHGHWTSYVHAYANYEKSPLDYLYQVVGLFDCSFATNLLNYFPKRASFFQCNSYEAPMNFLASFNLLLIPILWGIIKKIKPTWLQVEFGITVLMSILYFSFFHEEMSYRYYMMFYLPLFLFVTTYSSHIIQNNKLFYFTLILACVFGNVLYRKEWQKQKIQDIAFKYHPHNEKIFKGKLRCETIPSYPLNNFVSNFFAIGMSSHQKKCIVKQLFGVSFEHKKLSDCSFVINNPSFSCHEVSLSIDGKLKGTMEQGQNKCSFYFRTQETVSHFILLLRKLDFNKYVSLDDMLRHMPHETFDSIDVNCFDKYHKTSTQKNE
ncbi:MAG: hypothetical protein HON90_02045 [Halobacteriovoraceae bacterium]|nr:hypothetical protein [Halobacteriovoraceae bacterium]